MTTSKGKFKEWFGVCRELARLEREARVDHACTIGTHKTGERVITYSRGYGLAERNGLRANYGIYETRAAYWSRWHELRNEDNGRYNVPGYRRATLAAMRQARIYNPDGMNILP